MILIYIIAALGLIRVAFFLRDLYTGRYLSYDHEFDHGYCNAQGMHNSAAGKNELRAVIEKEIEQRRFTKHWYGAACWLADAEGKAWPRPWGDHYSNKFWKVIGNCTEKILYGVGWLLDNPIVAVALIVTGIAIGALLI